MKGKRTHPSVVLVVEDELQIRRLIKKLFKRYFPTCRVEQASDGVEAMQKMLMGPPKLLIVDLRLPLMGGLELCRLIQNQRMFQHTRILAITGYPTSDLTKELFTRGVGEFLPKPFELNELAGSIKRLLV